MSMLIDGKLVGSRTGETFTNLNPATEEPIGDIPDATPEDIDEAIGAARRAFDETDWATNHGFRRVCLEQLQTALEGAVEDLRADLVTEAGVPIRLTYAPQLDGPLAHGLRWPTSMIESFPWERDAGLAEAHGIISRRLVHKEAVGVVAAITPWNYPFEVEISKLGPALAMGNTVVLKPAPDTPAHALRIGRLIAEETDIPPGVVNIVTPRQHERGNQLLVDPRIDMVSFTGSAAVGRHIMETGAASFKRVFLELGGKSAHIVLDDADFPTAVPGAASVCSHAGQACAMITRLLLPRSRYDEGLELVQQGFAAVKLGDPHDPTVITGPVINQRQHERVLSYIQSGKDAGATVVAGGHGRPAGFDRGWYVEPTLFGDVTNDMAIAREEIFGPVLAVIPYQDDDEAVRIANDSPYGLSGAVSSASVDRAMSVARRIRTGTLRINGGFFYGADVPFGGYKASGIGRQNGVEGLEQYLETKTIGIAAGG
jgi:aldehyde dehydrogenase (NAD+)